MPAGDPGGNFAGSGGYGGNFGGAGGASMGSSPGGPAHGMLGFGGMSPGGFNSTTYGANAAGYGGPGSGVPGFGARVAAFAAQRRAQQAYNKVNGIKGRGGTVPINSVTNPTQPIVNQPAPYDPLSSIQTPPPPGWSYDDWMSQMTGQYGYPQMQNQMDVSPHSFGDVPSIDSMFGKYQDRVPAGINSWGGTFGQHPGTGGGVNLNSAAGVNGPAGRARGGPVLPGRTYTVGERGKETLVMGANGGGRVIPEKDMNRLRKFARKGKSKARVASRSMPFKVGSRDLALRGNV